MLYPMPVLVPTLYGRTDALLYDSQEARAGVVLIETTLARRSLVERVFDELALYFCAAGISVLRLAIQDGAGSARYGANVLGSVAFLRSVNIGEAVLISQTEHDTSPSRASAQYTADLAFAEFIDLISERATTPDHYQRLLGELVDMIRGVIDSVVGIARLLPLSAMPGTARPASAAMRAAIPDSSGPDEDGISAVYSLSIPYADQRVSAMAYIAALYRWTVTQLGLPRAPSSGISMSPRRAESARVKGQRGERRLSEVYWDQLEPAWREILAGLALRNPDGRRRIQELEGQGSGADPQRSHYVMAWKFLDQQARMDWLKACTKVFPIRELTSPAG